MKTRQFSVIAVAVMVLAAVAGTGTAGAAPVEPGPGWLRVLTSPAVGSQISVDGEWANTWAVNGLELPAGPHTVCFSDVPGWTAPPCGTVEVYPGMVHEISPEFTQRGYLQVVTEPAVPAMIVVDGRPANNWGVYTDLPTGEHEVCFGPVQGYAAPECSLVTLTAGNTSKVTGSYTPDPGGPGLAGAGMLRVQTSPPVASQIRVDGTIADTWGLDWMQIGVGSHQVCFGDVDGFATPDCEVVNVVEGETTEVTGSFTRQGYLQVSTDPGLPAQISVDGVVRDGWGLYTAVSTGTHQVCFAGVPEFPNFEPPECTTVNVSAGSTRTVVGEYTDVSPPAAGTWTQLRTPSGTGSWIPQDTNRNGLVVGQGYWCTDPCELSRQLSMPGGFDPASLYYTTVYDEGAIAGYDMDGSGTIQNVVVWTSPSAAGQVVSVSGGWTEPNINVISPDGSLIGSGISPVDNDRKLLLWSSPGAAPTTVTTPAGWAYASSEGNSWNALLTGWGIDGGMYRGLSVFPPSYTAIPLPDPAVGTFDKGVVSIEVNANGLMVGFGVNEDLSMTQPVAWTSSTAPPIVMDLPAGAVIGGLAEVSDSGRIIAAGQDAGGNPRIFVWTSPTASVTMLSQPAGSVVTSLIGSLDNGTIIANAQDAGGDFTLVWTSPGATPYRLTGPTGYTNVVAAGMSTDGAVYANATGPLGNQVVLAWSNLASTPVEISEPEAWAEPEIRIPTAGGPVIGDAFDENDELVGVMFRL